MGRPKKAIVDYFPHYVNHGKTMFTIENKFGNDGYAFWFKVLELLGATEQHFINCNDIETWEFLLAKTRLNEITVNNILTQLAKIGAIDSEFWDKKIIWSANFISNLQAVYSRRGIDVYTKPQLMEFLSTLIPLNGISANINPQSKVKYSKVEYSKDKYIVQNGILDERGKNFETFWESYPRKEDKQKALDKYKALLKTKKIKPEQILAHTIRYAEYVKAENIENQYIKLPATFLRAVDFTDNTPTPIRKSQESEIKRDTSVPQIYREQSDYIDSMESQGYELVAIEGTGQARWVHKKTDEVLS